MNRQLSFENDRQKVEISVVKQDADTEAAVAGAEFDFMQRMI